MYWCFKRDTKKKKYSCLKVLLELTVWKVTHDVVDKMLGRFIIVEKIILFFQICFT